MNYRVEFESLAEEDLNNIYDFIAEDSPIAAIEYVRRLKEHCGKLSFIPERGPRRDELAPGVRILLFKRSAIVIYRIADDCVHILRIYRAGRDYAADWNED